MKHVLNRLSLYQRLVLMFAAAILGSLCIANALSGALQIYGYTYNLLIFIIILFLVFLGLAWLVLGPLRQIGTEFEDSLGSSKDFNMRLPTNIPAELRRCAVSLNGLLDSTRESMRIVQRENEELSIEIVELSQLVTQLIKDAKKQSAYSSNTKSLISDIPGILTVLPKVLRWLIQL